MIWKRFDLTERVTEQISETEFIGEIDFTLSGLDRESMRLFMADLRALLIERGVMNVPPQP